MEGDVESVDSNPENVDELHLASDLYQKLKEELDTGWPWPLDSVQHFFEELWNKIVGIPYKVLSIFEEGITDLARALYERLIAPFEPMLSEIMDRAYSYLERVPEYARPLLLPFVLPTAFFEEFVLPKLEDIASKIWDIMPDWLKDAITFIQSFVDDVAEGLRSFISDPAGFLANVIAMIGAKVDSAVSTIRDHFQAAFDGATNVIAQALESIFKGVTDKISEFIDWIKGIPESAGKIAEAFREIIENIGGSISGIREALSDFGGSIKTFFSETLPNAIKNFGETLKEVIVVGFRSILQDAAELFKAIGAWMNEEVLEPLTNAFKWIFDKIKKFTSGFVNNLMNALKSVRDSIFGGDITKAAEITLELSVSGLGIMAILDVAGIKIAGSGIDLSGIKDFFSKIIDPKDTISTFIGVASAIAIQKPLEYVMKREFRTTLPSPGDLLKFYALNRLSKDELFDNMKYHGYADKWIELYEYSVWQLPRFYDVFMAYRRGKIPEKDYHTWLQILNIFETPRPGLSIPDRVIFEESTYYVPRLFDVAYAIESGGISRDEVRKWMKYINVHPDFEGFFEKIVYGRAYRRWREDAIQAILDQYRDGYITRDRAISELKSLGRTDDEIEELLKSADKEREKKIKERVYKLWLERLRRMRIDKKTFIDALVGLGFDADKVKADADYYYEKYIGEDFLEITKDERTAIKSRLLLLYKEGLITEDVLEARLKDLGYADKEIELIKENADLYYKYDFAMDYKNVVIEAFRRDKISYETALRMLTVDMKQVVGLAMREERARALLDKELVKKRLEAS